MLITHLLVSEIVNELRRVATSAQVNQPSPSSVEASPVRLSQLNQLQQSPYNGGYQQQQQQQSQLRPSSSTATPQQQQQQQKMKTLPRTQMPVIPAIFPELEELSYVFLFMSPRYPLYESTDLTYHGFSAAALSRVSQLEALAMDRHALKAFAKKLHSVQEFSKLREDVMTGNMRIAETTLGHESEMRALQGEVQALRSSLREAQESLAQKQSRQSRVLAVRCLLVKMRQPNYYYSRMHFFYFICSATAQMRSWTSSPPRRKRSTRRPTTSHSSLPTGRWTSRSSVRSICRSALCTTSAPSNSTRSCNIKDSRVRKPSLSHPAVRRKANGYGIECVE